MPSLLFLRLSEVSLTFFPLDQVSPRRLRLFSQASYCTVVSTRKGSWSILAGFEPTGCMKPAAQHLRRILNAIRIENEHAVRSDLDQSPATSTTVLRRASLLGRRDLDVLLLGDDDLLSVVLANTLARRRISV